MGTSALNPNLAPISDALIERSNGTYDAAFVRDLVAHVASEFEDAPIQDFVRLLVAKEAADELRRLHALRPIAS